MLSPDEYKGLKAILDDIDDEELFSILETVTKRMFTTRIRSVATEKILSCTAKPSDLLRRQKVTKKILFNYLMKQSILVLADWGKPTLVKKCLELWGSTETCKESDFVETVNENIQCNQTYQMGIAFSQWFFKILNTLSDFGPEHFWPGCYLSAQLFTPTDTKEVSVTGANDVAVFLSNLVLIDKFYFHANNSKDSIMLEEEQHGLVKIMIGGVLHQHSNCVGLFDSAFGLVKNPDSESTYKIQLIKLKMQVNQHKQGVLPVNNHLPICQTV